MKEKLKLLFKKLLLFFVGLFLFMIILGIISVILTEDEENFFTYLYEGNTEKVLYYIKNKDININITNEHGETPLMVSISSNYTEMAKELINSGADINAKNTNFSDNYYTPLRYASELGGNEEIVKLLIDKGADLVITNADGSLHTALMYTTNTYIAKMLIDAGTDVNITNRAGENALIQNTICNSEIVKLLIDNGIKINIKTELRTPLSYAAYFSDDIKTLKLLIDAGADVNHTDSYMGNTPLMSSSSSEIAELLIKYGANVNHTNKFGHTALMFASIGGRAEVVETLIKYGALINAKNNEGKTALMYASENGKAEVVKTLIEYGALINAKDNEGKTALMYVPANKKDTKTKKYTDTIRILKNFGAY